MKNNEPDVTVAVDTSNILGMLSTQLDNFPIMKSFLKQSNITTGVLFIPQTLALIDGEVTRNAPLAYDCFSFLDLTATLVAMTDVRTPEQYLERIVDSISYIREPEDYSDLTLAKPTMDNLIFNERDDVKKLVLSNKYLLALYIYSIVSTVFYK